MKLSEAIRVFIKNDLALPKFLCEMNNHHVTNLISININNQVSISCNTFVIVMEY